MCYAYTTLLLDNRTIPFISKRPRSGQQPSEGATTPIFAKVGIVRIARAATVHLLLFRPYCSTLELCSLTRRYDDGSLWERRILWDD
jgi:hypothetical protein